MEKNIQNIPLLSMTPINSYNGSCGTLGEEKKLIVINHIGLVSLK